jgi:hypothetical protein
MSWKLVFHEECKIVETIFVGNIPPQELQEAVKASLALAKEKNTNLYLGNCIELGHSGSPVDIFELALFYENIPVDRLSNEAVLLPVSIEAAKAMKFYETVTTNRGFQVRVFGDRQEAIRWLAG